MSARLSSLLVLVAVLGGCAGDGISNSRPIPDSGQNRGVEQLTAPPSHGLADTVSLTRNADRPPAE